jgi:hypothetical protein
VSGSDRPKTFGELLLALGHIYFPSDVCLEDPVDQRVRHIPGNVDDRGNIFPLCGTEPITGNNSWIESEEMWLDVNCPECRTLKGLDFRSVTKRSLMIDCVHILMNIEQHFLDAMHYNGYERAQGEPPRNPDPDGELAEAWERNADQIIQMMERFRPTMAKHAGRFGWPEEIERNEKTGCDGDLRQAPDHP